MVSLKKYLGIVVMMTMLFIIFLFSVIINDQGSFYDINEYVTEERISGEEQWQASEKEELVFLIGTENNALVDVVTQWCTYTKRRLQLLDQPAEYEQAVKNAQKPAMILMDAKQLDFGEEYRDLIMLTEQEVPLVFCTIPERRKILTSKILGDILGILSVMPQDAEATGIQLYDGFFLGGEINYIAKNKEEEKRQDMNLTIPWYLLKGGTKTYMVGTLEREELLERVGLKEDAEGITGYLPKIIWRNHYNKCPVFVVNGDYMSSLAGLGILSSFCYEIKDYELYPVVNAQNVLIQNYPNLSEENETKLLEIYSRDPQMVFQGIMWPSVSAMAKANGLKLSCFFNTQQLYHDEIEPDAEVIPFYLKQLREINSEAGLALSYDADTSFEEMIKKDTKFYEAVESEYCYQIAFVKAEDMENVRRRLNENNILRNLVTVGSEYQQGDTLLSYLTDTVTLQRTTATAKEHSYMDDFVLRGIQTALMYSNVLLDLQDAVWPQEETDEWQHLYDEMASNVTTYWSDFRGYEQTSLSESDLRVRTLLNLQYSHERENNTIVLQVENTKDSSWFMLRTHDEKIVEITGGEFQTLETNAYLINAKDTTVKIILEPVSLKEQNK